MISNRTDTATGLRALPAPAWLLPLAMAALLAGMWAGLLRLGWAWPPLRPTLPMAHGPLMVGGFLGTVIGLERAVGTGKRWSYAAPCLTSAGTVALLLAGSSAAGPLLITLGSVVLTMTLWTIYRLQPALFTVTLVLGGGAWLGGNLLWLTGRTVPEIVLWWAGFLVLTIAGERLELSRLLRLSPIALALFAVLVLLFLIGLAGSVVDLASGTRMAGVVMLGMALWLLWYDIARRRIKAGGQARYIAIALLTGYVWLGIAGLLAIRYGGFMAGPAYDAMLHAIFLGFVFSMIFGHALIIFPALLHVRMVYHPWLYSHLVLLHLTLALRVAGDLIPYWPARLWGGLLNGAVLLLFLVNTVLSVRRTE
ncbi:MAG: hypothetical protein KDE20_06885 [Caldilineaceae bacterium]|nr:hypothetical protein [Caldilineaceae bacterium]